jgi:hypothetical protein
MKENTQQRTLIFIGLLILGVGGFFGKKIGDAFTDVSNLKTFQSVLRLAKPIQISIHQIQTERSFMLRYLNERSEVNELRLKEASKRTDEKLKNVSQQLKVTQVRLLAIPESEISDIRKALAFQRDYNQKNATPHSEPVRGYSESINQLYEYLEKLYEFGGAEKFKANTDVVLSLVNFNEDLKRDKDYISNIINRTFTLGELALFKQRFINEEVKMVRLLETDHDLLRNEIQKLFKSDEWKAIQAFRKRFETLEPDLKGSIAVSQQYQELMNTFSKILIVKELELSSTLHRSVHDQKEKIIHEGLINGAIGLGVLLLLVGLYILLRRITPAF